MTTITRNFGEAAGTKLTHASIGFSLFGAAGSGFTNADNAAVVSTANPGKAKWSSAGNYFTLIDVGASAHWVRARIHNTGTAGALVFRASIASANAAQNLLYLTINAAGSSVSVRSIVAGAASTLVATLTGVTGIVAGWDWLVDAHTDPTKATIFVDRQDGAGLTPVKSTLAASSIDISGVAAALQTGTQIGFGATSTFASIDPYVSAFSAADVDLAYITFTDVTAFRVVQRTKGTTTGALLAVPVQLGAAVGSIEAQVVLAGTSTVVLDWVQVAGATAKGATTVNVTGIPQGGRYNLRLRAKDGGGTVVGSAFGANAWGVGLVLKLSGQSNIAHLLLSSGLAIATGLSLANVSHVSLTTGLWVNGCPQANSGLAAFGAYLALLTGLPIGFGSSAVDSTTMAQHAPPAGSLWNSGGAAHELPVLTALGGDIEGIIWSQGESDLATVQATYLAAWNAYVDEHQTLTGRTGADELLVSIAQISRISASPFGYTSGASDGDRVAFRKMMADWAAAETSANARIAFDRVTSDHIDAQHPVWAEVMRDGYKWAREVAFALGFVSDRSATGPVPLSLTRVGGTLNFKFSLAGSTALASRTGGATITGFRYRTDGGAWSVLSGTLSGTDTVAFTVTAPAPGVVEEIDYLGGAAAGTPDLTNFVTGNVPARGAIPSGAVADTVMLPATATVQPLAVASAPVVLTGTGAGIGIGAGSGAIATPAPVSLSGSTTVIGIAGGTGAIAMPTPAVLVGTGVGIGIAATGAGVSLADLFPTPPERRFTPPDVPRRFVPPPVSRRIVEFCLMPIPLRALRLPEPMDPADVASFEFDARPYMPPDETVDGFAVTLGTAAIAAGVTLGSGARAAAIVGLDGDPASGIQFWLAVDAGRQADAAFDAGVQAAVKVSFDHGSPAEHRERTCVVTIRRG